MLWIIELLVLHNCQFTELYCDDDALQMSLMADLLIWSLAKLSDSLMMLAPVMKVMMATMKKVMRMMKMMMVVQNLIKVYMLNV